MHYSDDDDLVGPRRGAPRPRDENDEDLVGPRRGRGGRSASADAEDGQEKVGRARRSILDDDEYDGPDRRPARRPQGGAEYEKGGRDAASLMSIVRDVPSYLKLLARLARDPRVSKADKAIVAAVLVYVVSPVDLVPDWVFPVVGQIEDIYLLALALSRLLNNAGMDVLLDHWDGDPASLGMALDALDGASALLPGPIRSILGHRG
ncbi:YkvA family protein [Longimicrobium sp.]|uniref:YkvA family protein n=1 Tax=Longimicrobium sp. TaxID=2029185 RepID=UPI003B3AB601